MRLFRSSVGAVLTTMLVLGGLSVPHPADARDRPGTPNHEALFVCGYKVSYRPTLCGSFNNTATEVVKIEMEMTRNGAPFPYDPARLDCNNATVRTHQNMAVLNAGTPAVPVPGVHETTDEICFDLNRTYGRKNGDPDYAYIFELQDADFSAQYCARFRARRTSDQVVSQVWSNYACVQTPPIPPAPAKPNFSVSFSGSQAYLPGGVGNQSGNATVGETAKVIPTTVTVTSGTSANALEYRLADTAAPQMSFDGTIEPTPFDRWDAGAANSTPVRTSALRIRPDQSSIGLSLCAYNAGGKVCEVKDISVLDQSPELRQMPAARIPVPRSASDVTPAAARLGVPIATSRFRNRGMMPGVDLPGSDYSSKPIAGTAVDCADACALDGKCVAWTWVKPGIQNTQAMCWLKNAVPSQTPNANVTSGIKSSPVP
jgi:hypothetical protein